MFPVVNGKLTAAGSMSMLAYKYPELYNPDLIMAGDMNDSPAIKFSDMVRNRTQQMMSDEQNAGIGLVSAGIRGSLLKGMSIGKISRSSNQPLGLAFRMGLESSAIYQNAITTITGTKDILKPRAMNTKAVPTLLKYMTPTSTAGGIRSFAMWNFLMTDMNELREKDATDLAISLGGHMLAGTGMDLLKGKVRQEVSSHYIDKFTDSIPESARKRFNKMPMEDRVFIAMRKEVGESEALASKVEKWGKSILDKKAPGPTKGFLRTALGWVGGSKNSDEVLNSVRASTSKAGARMATIGGIGLRMTNTVSGIIAAGHIIDGLYKQHVDVNREFARNALSYETAYTTSVQSQMIGTERQRAIEAMQNSSLNIRNFMGSEASMMH